MGHPWPLFHIFRLFKQQINVKNCPSSIRCWNWTHALLNMSLLPLPLDQGSRPLQRTLIIFDKDQDYLNFRWIVCVSVGRVIASNPEVSSLNPVIGKTLYRTSIFCSLLKREKGRKKRPGLGNFGKKFHRFVLFGKLHWMCICKLCLLSNIFMM